MKRQYCRNCDKETWHNATKSTKTTTNPWRCVNCGEPRRFGAKYTKLEGGKVITHAAQE